MNTKPIFDGFYSITDTGRIFSNYYPRWGKQKKRKKRESPKEMKTAFNRNGGYQFAALKVKGKNKNVYIHRLVLQTFKGHGSVGMQCDHINGDKTDNRLENLQWVTHSENQQRRRLFGRDSRGCKSTKAKLTKSNIKGVLHYLAVGKTQKWIGQEYGVSSTVICRIHKGLGYVDEVNEITGE